MLTEAQIAELDAMLANWRRQRHYNFMVLGHIFYGVMLAAAYGY